MHHVESTHLSFVG